MKKETVKEVITAGKTHRTGWYFAKDKTFTIPVLLAVGRYSEAQHELCGALAKVAHFRNVPKTIREIPSDDPGVNDEYCVGTHCTVDGPYGPVQFIKMRDFDFCNACISTLAHELTHAVRSALIDRNVFLGTQDRACEAFSYVFSEMLEDFLDQLENGDGWAPTEIIPITEDGETVPLIRAKKDNKKKGKK